MTNAPLLISALTRVCRAVTAYGTLGTLAVSLGVNVFLGLMVVKSRSATSAHSMPVGARVPPLTIHDLSGKNVRLTWPSSENRLTVVYLFSPSCGWCRRNSENLKALGDARHTKYRLIPISLSSVGLADYVVRYGLTFPVYAEPTAPAGAEFVYTGTPETLVISPDGTVKRVWRGAFTETVKEEIEAYLGVQLPGIIS